MINSFFWSVYLEFRAAVQNCDIDGSMQDCWCAATTSVLYYAIDMSIAYKLHIDGLVQERGNSIANFAQPMRDGVSHWLDKSLHWSYVFLTLTHRYVSIAWSPWFHFPIWDAQHVLLVFISMGWQSWGSQSPRELSGLWGCVVVDWQLQTESWFLQVSGSGESWLALLSSTGIISYPPLLFLQLAYIKSAWQPLSAVQDTLLSYLFLYEITKQNFQLQILYGWLIAVMYFVFDWQGAIWSTLSPCTLINPLSLAYFLIGKVKKCWNLNWTAARVHFFYRKYVGPLALVTKENKLLTQRPVEDFKDQLCTISVTYQWLIFWNFSQVHARGSQWWTSQLCFR